MNYLAHAYLSFGDPEVLAGNMISDFIKGKKKFDYPPRILAGIDFHREIDRFTDYHPVSKGSADIYRPHYGLYCSAFIDVVYDHFLARQLAAEGQFKEFTDGVYWQLQKQINLLPVGFARMLPYMIRDNWLFNYQYDDGIKNSFAGLVHRAAYLSDSTTAYQLLRKHYDQLNDDFRLFFPELYNFSLRKYSDIH